MATTYFLGCWWLPAALTLLDFDVVKLGKPGAPDKGFFVSATIAGNGVQEGAMEESRKDTPEHTIPSREYEKVDL